MIRGDFHLFSCRSGQPYAEKVMGQLEYLINQRGGELRGKDHLRSHEHREMEFIDYFHDENLSIGKVDRRHFEDDEMKLNLESYENVRDKDVYLIQNAYNTTEGLLLSQNIMETLITLDSLRRVKAGNITLVWLYFAYGRGDKEHGKGGIPARLMADLLTTAGMDRLLTMDLHADQITGFFDKRLVQVEHLHASPLIIHYAKSIAGIDATIAAPDTGAAGRSEFYAKHLKDDMVMGYKKRDYSVNHKVDNINVLGKPHKRAAFIVDDIVSKGSTMIKMMEQLRKKGVKEAYLGCTHPLLICDAIERFDKFYQDRKHPFKRLIGTDAIPQDDAIKERPWYVEIDTSRFIAKAIYEMHTSGSLTKLHDPFCVEKYDLWVGTNKD